jgi:hypothetical protein
MNYFIFFLSFLFLTLSYSQGRYHKPEDLREIKEKHLQDLLDKKEFFKLRTFLTEKKDSIDYPAYLYYNSYVQNVFNKLDSSNQSIDKLFSEYRSSLTDSMSAQLLQVKLMNYFNLYNYKAAYQTGQFLIEKYRDHLDTTEYNDIVNFNVMLDALSDVPAQKITFEGDAEISWRRDSYNYMYIPVTLSNNDFEFVFDCGANLSTLSKSTAQKIGLKFLSGNIEGKGSTDIKVSIEYGVADSIRIGPILIENVIFAVLPDEQLEFPEGNLKIKGIIGYPIMHQLKETRFYKNGRLMIPKESTRSDLSNLALDGLSPVVSFATDRDTLIFTFDSGGKKTVLYKAYFDKYKEDILKNGEFRKIERRGVGGTVNEEVYTLKDFNFYVGDKKATLPSVDVFIKYYEPEKLYYGRIGQDVISQFDEMIMNFDEMYVSFK